MKFIDIITRRDETAEAVKVSTRQLACAIEHHQHLLNTPVPVVPLDRLAALTDQAARITDRINALDEQIAAADRNAVICEDRINAIRGFIEGLTP